jgi:hypothetical protein
MWHSVLSDTFNAIESYDELVVRIRCSQDTWSEIQSHLNLGDSHRLWTAHVKTTSAPYGTFELEGLYGTRRSGTKS